MIRDEDPELADSILEHFDEDDVISPEQATDFLLEELKEYEPDLNERIEWIASLMDYMF